MKRGGPKTSVTTVPRRTRARTAASPAAGVAEAVAEAKTVKRKSRDNTQPRQQKKQSLLAFMLSDERLSPEAKARIKDAAVTPVTPDSLGAFAHYSVEVARTAMEGGELAMKDYIVALNKAGSQLAAAAQLSQSAPGAGTTVVEVRFTGMGATSSHPDCKPRPVPDPVIGDIIDADG